MRLRLFVACLVVVAALTASPRRADACSCYSWTIELISPKNGGTLPANGAIIGRYAGPLSLDTIEGTSVSSTIEAMHIAAYPVGGCMTPYTVQRPAQPLEVGSSYSVPNGHGSTEIATFTVTPPIAPSIAPIAVEVTLFPHEPFEHVYYYCHKPQAVHQSARVTIGFSEPQQVLVVAGVDYKFGNYHDEEVGYYGAVVSAIPETTAITLPVVSTWCDKCIEVWVYDLLLGTLLHESKTCLDPSQCAPPDAGTSDAGAVDASNDASSPPLTESAPAEGCACAVQKSGGDEKCVALLALAAAAAMRRRQRPLDRAHARG